MIYIFGFMIYIVGVYDLHCWGLWSTLLGFMFYIVFFIFLVFLIVSYLSPFFSLLSCHFDQAEWSQNNKRKQGKKVKRKTKTNRRQNEKIIKDKQRINLEDVFYLHCFLSFILRLFFCQTPPPNAPKPWKKLGVLGVFLICCLCFVSCFVFVALLALLQPQQQKLKPK